MKDELDKSEVKYIPKKPTKLTIVCGLAGSGKSTFVRSVEQAYADSIYHDMWVECQYDVPQVKVIVNSLFTEDELEYIDKPTVLKYLKEYPELNTLLANYFKSKFSILLASKLHRELGELIVECPFLDENIKALKNTFKNRVRVILIDTHKDLIIERLKHRGWDDNRITMSLMFQKLQLDQYEHLVDEYV